MRPFEYARPQTEAEAVDLLSDHDGKTAVLAGGTDLMTLLRRDAVQVERVVDIKHISSMQGISQADDGVLVGSLTTLEDAAESPLLAEHHSVLQVAEAHKAIQIQQAGTLVGDLCQLPHCWYFRNGYGLLGMDNGQSMAQAGDNRYHAIFGNSDSWVVWNLTGGPRGGVHVTDVTNASRTMLMDLETLDWDDELLSFFGIPRRMLPQIRPSSSPEPYGTTQSTGPMGGEVPVTGILGDQQAAMVGQVCLKAGEAKNTYGTGNFLLLNTGEKIVRSTNGLLTTVCYQFGDAKPVYALEGSIAVTGSAVQWLRDQLGIISGAAQSESLARQVADNGGVYFVPAFSGLFAPYWRSDARGAIVGLSRFNTNAHVARATLEAICYQSRDVVDAMEADSGVHLEVLKPTVCACRSRPMCSVWTWSSRLSPRRPRWVQRMRPGWRWASGPTPMTCAPTGRRGSAGVRTGLRSSAATDTRAGRKRCSAPWTGSTCPDRHVAGETISAPQSGICGAEIVLAVPQSAATPASATLTSWSTLPALTPIAPTTTPSTVNGIPPPKMTRPPLVCSRP